MRYTIFVGKENAKDASILATARVYTHFNESDCVSPDQVSSYAEKNCAKPLKLPVDISTQVCYYNSSQKEGD
jgi:hypothetical protein